MNKQTTVEAGSMSSSLVRALAEIEGAAKDKVNPHFKSKYADIGSVIDAIKPVLAKHDLGFTQHPQPSESGIIIETMLHHSSGESLSLGTLYVPANKLDPQAFGSALTYARRYALMTAFGVPAEDDDGNAAARPANGNGEFVQREKVNGVSKIKAALNKLMTQGNAITDLDAFNALIKEHAEMLTAMKNANHEYWTGDGADSEGFKAWIKRRREELAPVQEAEPSLTFQMLVSVLDECTSANELQGFLKQHGDAVETLDGAESRDFEARYAEKERSLNALETVTSGS